MDELLRAYAKLRREQADPLPPLHPATRRLLQDEVRRTFRTAQAQPGQIGLGAWLAARWRLVATGGAAVVLFVLVTVLNAPSWNQSSASRHSVVSPSVAKADLPAANRSLTVAAPEPAKTLATPGPAPSPESTVASIKPPAPEANTIAPPLANLGLPPANRPETAAASQPVETLAPAAPAPLTQPSLASAPPPAPAADNTAPPLIATPLMARSAEAANAPAAAAVPAMALPSEVNNAGASTRNFVQINAQSRSRALQPPVSNVLAAFQIERVGANVRIIDADGSVYQGEVLGRAARRGALGGGREAAEKALKDANANANWAFKVSGTNKNLRQNVVFIGNVLDMPETVPTDVALEGFAQNANAPQANNAQNANRLQSAQGSFIAAPAAGAPPAGIATQNAVQNWNASQAQNAQNAQNATNARRLPPAQIPLITGKVQVGGGKAFDIEARPPAP
jgi:hypothetical protein